MSIEHVCIIPKFSLEVDAIKVIEDRHLDNFHFNAAHTNPVLKAITVFDTVLFPVVAVIGF